MEDRDIIQLYIQRDEAAIKATAEKYGAYCSRIAGNILLSEEDVDECISDTWLRIWKLIPPYNPSSLKVFAGKIARGFAVNRCRASFAGKRSMEQYALALEELEDVVQATETVETEVDAKIIAAAISEFLRTQHKLYADIFVRRYFYLDSVAQLPEPLQSSKARQNQSFSE